MLVDDKEILPGILGGHIKPPECQIVMARDGEKARLLCTDA